MVQEFIQTIIKTHSSYRQAVQREMREHDIDLSFEMIFILRCLMKEELMNQQELASKVYKDKSSLSYLIKNMEKKGFVERIEDEVDKRNKLVKLTTKAKLINEEISIIIEKVYATIEEQINKEHIETSIDYMNEFNLILRNN